MYGVPIQSLLENGVHFGHRASRWNPKMGRFIFGRRNLIHIIDLKETLRGLLKACVFLQNLTSQGGSILVVGTKRQAQGLVEDFASEVSIPCVTERWLGGTLTNFETIRSRLHRLEELEGMEADGTLDGMSKKAISRFNREKRKIFTNLNGIRNMTKLPAAVVIVDPKKEKTAVSEARKLGIPVIAILDTDCDPELIDIPIPGNDDAVRSIGVLMDQLKTAIVNGRQVHDQLQQENARRREEDDARAVDARKKKAAEQKKVAAERAELDKVLKKAREARAVQKAAEEGVQARVDEDVTAVPDAKPEEPAAAPAESTPTPAPEAAPAAEETPVAEETPTVEETKPGPMGPEPTEG